MDASPRFFDLLGFLARQEVEFILVGGVAAILEGAPVSTFDLGIMIRPTAENRGERLLRESEGGGRFDPLSVGERPLPGGLEAGR